MTNRAIFADKLRAAERHLMRRDDILRPHIKKHRPWDLKPGSRHFETLVIGIISQQLSGMAARTIVSRFKALYHPARFPAAAQILQTEADALRGVGLSGQKASYIKDLASRAESGALKLNRLARMTDDQVIEELVAVKGIGVWTAHMFLMFSLGRLNILPVGDLGIRKAIERAYGLSALPGPEEIEQIALERRWHPYCSVASWYLWKSLE